MADGDQMLDANGNVILQDDGDALLSNGADDDCCCGATPQHCWARWEAVYDCETATLEKTLLSMDCASATPDYAAGWTQTEQNGSFTKWLYDQDLGECVDGVCDEESAPTEPDIADPNTTSADEACCPDGKLCIFVYSVTYTPPEGGGMGTFGEIQHVMSYCDQLAEDHLVDEWFYYSGDESGCTFWYRKLGDCCENNEGCAVWPADPSLTTEDQNKIAYTCDECLNYGGANGINLSVTLTGTTARGCINRSTDSVKTEGSVDTAWNYNWLANNRGENDLPAGATITQYEYGACDGPPHEPQPVWDKIYIDLSISGAGVAGGLADIWADVWVREGTGAAHIGTFARDDVPVDPSCCNWPRFIIVPRSPTADTSYDLFSGGFLIIENLSCPDINPP